MKSYIKLFILLILFMAFISIILVGIMLLGEGTMDSTSWRSTSIYTCCVTSIIHFITDWIYKESKNKNSKIKITKKVISLTFLISMYIQIISTIYICFGAWKLFGSIHPIEYFSVAIFLLLSIYSFKRASYTLIGRGGKNNGKEE